MLCLNKLGIKKCSLKRVPTFASHSDAKNEDKLMFNHAERNVVTFWNASNVLRCFSAFYSALLLQDDEMQKHTQTENVIFNCTQYWYQCCMNSRGLMSHSNLTLGGNMRVSVPLILFNGDMSHFLQRWLDLKCLPNVCTELISPILIESSIVIFIAFFGALLEANFGILSFEQVLVWCLSSPSFNYWLLNVNKYRIQ